MTPVAVVMGVGGRRGRARRRRETLRFFLQEVARLRDRLRYYERRGWAKRAADLREALEERLVEQLRGLRLGR